MCRIPHTLALVILAASCGELRAAKPLGIGDPAPPLEVTAFLKGQEVRAFERGTTYVLEFSQTTCAPCIASMPHLSELQKKYDGKVVVMVVFVGETTEQVQRLVQKRGDVMGFTVAVEKPGQMERGWLTAAGLRGVPRVFVVDGSGNIAWVGQPDDLAQPLQAIVDGTFDPKQDAIRLRFERIDHEYLNGHIKRLNDGNEASDRIARLIEQKQYAKAVALAERSMLDFPYRRFRFGLDKLGALARDPTQSEAALDYAAHLSAEARQYWGDLVKRPAERDVTIAEELAHIATDTAEPALASDFAAAARVLLRRAEADLAAVHGDDAKAEVRIRAGRVTAQLHAAEKDYGRAVERLQEVAHLLRARRPEALPEGDRPDFEKRQANELKSLQSQIEEYRTAAAKAGRQ